MCDNLLWVGESFLNMFWKIWGAACQEGCVVCLPKSYCRQSVLKHGMFHSHEIQSFNPPKLLKVSQVGGKFLRNRKILCGGKFADVVSVLLQNIWMSWTEPDIHFASSRGDRRSRREGEDPPVWS